MYSRHSETIIYYIIERTDITNMNTYEIRNNIEWLYTESLYDNCCMVLESSDKPNIFKRIFNSVRVFINKCIERIRKIFTQKKLDDMKEKCDRIKKNPTTKNKKIKMKDYEKQLKTCDKALNEAKSAKSVEQLNKSKERWANAILILSSSVLITLVAFNFVPMAYQAIVRRYSSLKNEVDFWETSFDNKTDIAKDRYNDTVYYTRKNLEKARADYAAEILKMKSKITTEQNIETCRHINELNKIIDRYENIIHDQHIDLKYNAREFKESQYKRKELYQKEKKKLHAIDTITGKRARVARNILLN